MSDETKDFRYYADKAESYLDAYRDLDGAYTRQSAETLLRTAEVYSRLAAAVPTQFERCPAMKIQAREQRKLRCDRPADHAGEHIDKTGIAF